MKKNRKTTNVSGRPAILFVTTLLVTAGCGGQSHGQQLVAKLDTDRAKQVTEFARELQEKCGPPKTLTLLQNGSRKEVSVGDVIFRLKPTATVSGKTVTLQVSDCSAQGMGNEVIMLADGRQARPQHATAVLTYLDGQPADPEGDILVCSKQVDQANGAMVMHQDNVSKVLDSSGYTSLTGNACWELQSPARLFAQRDANGWRAFAIGGGIGICIGLAVLAFT